jgi:hypothetical protein
MAANIHRSRFVGGTVDDAVAALARRQHGNVSRQQLLDLGLGPAAITYRARHGRLHRVHAGVYSVGRPPAAPLERAAAAVLACGAGAALSHESALALWGFVDRWPARFDVTVSVDRRPSGITVHRSETFTGSDIRRQHGIPVTSPARALLDCAPRLTRRKLTRAVNDALRSPFLTRSQLSDVCARNPGHPGAKLLAWFISFTGGPTRSEFEDGFLRFCERFGLPSPKVNTAVCGFEVDALFEAERVIVELDGWDFHQGRDSFERDRRRDADTLVAGLVTIRITWERLMGAPGPEAARLKTILAQRAAG